MFLVVQDRRVFSILIQFNSLAHFYIQEGEKSTVRNSIQFNSMYYLFPAVQGSQMLH
jgi:hypothetical protein